MATVTVASANPASFSHTFFTLDDSLPAGRPREASFSSYLSAADEGFSPLHQKSRSVIDQIGRYSVADRSLNGEFTDHRTTNSVQVTVGSGRKKAAAAAVVQDDELDVFGAEKYFNGGMDGEDQSEIKSETTAPWKAAPSPLKEPMSTGRRARQLGTPSTCSEASGNSRSLLLRDAGQLRERSSPRPHPVGKWFLGIFPCSACSDGVSVEVDKDRSKGSDHGGGFSASRRFRTDDMVLNRCNEETLWRKGSGFTGRREDFFSFNPPPVLKPALQVQEDQKLARVVSSSMDVFGASLIMGKEELASTSLRRSVTIMSPFSGGGGARVDHDDVGSDASSDLFEIESLSTGTFPLGGGASASSTTCYEPSEASIEWSVVTASAANFSLASDGEVSPPKGGRRQARRPQNQQRSGGGGGGGGLLLGCGSAKAVNVVAPTAAHRAQEYKAEAAPQQQRQQRHKSMDVAAMAAPEMRYHAESPRSVDFEHGRAAHVLAPRGIPRPGAPPHSPRLQLPLL